MPAATVEGMAKFKAHIKSIPYRTRKAMSDAIQTGADELVAMQKRLAPVANVDGGELRDSIKAEWGAAAKEGASDRQGQLGLKGQFDLAMTVSAGDAKAYYAAWVEFGTAQKGSTAQPFFFPAYRTLKKRIKARISRAMGKAMRGG